MTIPFRLAALNLTRWIRENAVVWGLLSFIYSLTLVVILQPVLERALKRDIAFRPLWAATCLLLLVPGALEQLPLPSIAWGAYLARPFSRLAGGLGGIYLRHELRRGATWLTLGLVAIAGAFLLQGRSWSMYVIVAQLPVQRALYSLYRWRAVAVGANAERGGEDLLRAIGCAQAMQAALAWLGAGALSGLGFGSGFADRWLSLGPGALGAALCASAVALEGDSGKPWMTNFVSLAVGTLGGFACLYSPWFLLLAAYFAWQMHGAVGSRLLSVEHLDEDVVVP